MLMMKTRHADRNQTLFDPVVTSRIEKNGPFFTGLHMLAESEDNLYLPEEPAIFANIAEHEVALYEPRGWICGAIELRKGRGRRINLSKIRKPWKVPAYVEPDALSFSGCSASGVLLVQNDSIFMRLFSRKVAQKLNLVIVTGCGVPRMGVRRLLYRLCNELSLPVFVLVDSSTWGYFVFSLLKRGAIAPHSRFEYASIGDLRFLGLRAGNIAGLPSGALPLRAWKSGWDLRLRCMMQYPCFRKLSWQRELAAFLKQHGSVTLAGIYDHVGDDEFIRAFLETPIRSLQWLT